METHMIPFDDENIEHWYESLAEWQGGDYELHQLIIEEEERAANGNKTE